jgi:glycine betaine/choline ABC-type transport system substrate-binding protein
MSRSLRTVLAALAALAMVLALAACGEEEETTSSEPSGGGTADVEPIEEVEGAQGTPITIGSKNFTEQYILGEIYSQALEAAGYDVTKELDLGPEQVAYKALQAGEVDAYPEYTGTALTSFFDFDTDEVPTEEDAEEAYELAREEYAKRGITAPAQAPFNNTYILATTAETAEELGNPETISDLIAAEGADELSIAGFPECRQRTDCLLGLEQVYDYQPEFVSTEGQYEALDSDQADLLFAFATDGALSTDQYYTFEDDQSLFRSYHITLSMRDQAAEAIGPEGIEIVERVQEPLTEDVMRELNARVDLDRQEPADVAADYLREAGFVQ